MLDKVGNYSPQGLPKFGGIFKKLFVKSLQNNTPIFVSHDENLNVIRAQLVRKWVKMTLLDWFKLFLAWLLVLFLWLQCYMVQVISNPGSSSPLTRNA